MTRGTEVIETTLKKSELFSWFEEHCLWARRVDPADKDILSQTGNWLVCVSSGVHDRSITYGGITLEVAIQTAKDVHGGSSK